MQVVVPASENSIGIDGLLKNTNPSSSTPAIIDINLSTNSNGYGIYGAHYGSGIGVYGYSNSRWGGQFNSSTGFSVETSGKLRYTASGGGTLGESSCDFLYFLKLQSGKIIKKTSITVQSTGTSWTIIDNDFQF